MPAPVAPQPDKLLLTSPDLTQDLLQHLQEAAPQVFREGKIDFARLREALGGALDTDGERYGLSWAGKREAFQQIKAPSTATLRPQPADSVRWDTTENAIIEGDNLEVLKLLQKPYHGQVKLIYIDPPYNTGNEFIYPDNFREGLADYLRYSGQLTEAGTAASTNRDTSGRYHSAWLSLMYPRLLLARNLLREDGVIFVSIDDHEVHNLRLLMDEVFGEENMLGQLAVITNPKGRVLGEHFAKCHDYLLVYSRAVPDQELGLTKSNEEVSKQYTESDTRGAFRLLELRNTHRQFGKHNRPNLCYPFWVNPSDGSIALIETNGWVKVEPVWNDGFEGCWTWGTTKAKAELHLLVARNIEGNWKIFRKAYATLDSGENVTKKLKSVLDEKNFFTEKGQAAFDSLMGKSLFQAPKPVELIKTLAKLAGDKEALILDFFGGSGTTAEAVLTLNEEDNGNRRFILVQLPEPTGKADYPTIAHITRERVRRVVARLDKAEAGTFTFDPARAARRGFRAFSLAASNFHVWDPTAPDPAAQLALFADNRAPGRTDDDRLWELVLKAGLPLGSALTSFDAAGLPAYTLAEGRVVLCVAAPLTRAALRALLAPPTGPPQLVVCLDAAFQGPDADALKTNAVLEARGLNVTFKTA